MSANFGSVATSLLVLGLLLVPSLSVAQIDTEFWFAAPSVTEGHGDRPILLRFTSLDEAANVLIRQPASPSFSEMRVTVPAGQSRTIDLTARIGLVENLPAHRVLNKGLHIQSDEPITAYYEVNNELNPDIFTLKGRNALGKEFVIPAQNYWSRVDWYNPPATSGAEIVATENDTRVTIVPSVRTGSHAAGTPFEVVLDRGQTYSLTSSGSLAQYQLTGTRITADQFIAVTLKDDSNQNGPCHDLGGDQLVPLDVLGREYIAVRGFLGGGDQVFVQAITDNTSVVIDGNTGGAIQLDAGEMRRFDLRSRAMHIETSEPTYVLHATGFGCEIGLALLPKLTCTGSQSVSVTRSTPEEFGLILIARAGDEGGFVVNGRTDLVTAADFALVAGSDSTYVAAQINLTAEITAGSVLQISNALGTFHLGTINGGERSGCRYGYFSDFKTLKILTEISKICQGSELLLEASGADNYRWFGDDIVQDRQEDMVTVSPDSATTYGVIGFDDSNGCLDTAYLNVEVFAWPRPSVSISHTCINQAVQISYTGVEELERISWILDRDTFMTGWLDTLVLGWSEPGPQSLEVRAVNPAGCQSDTTFTFTVGGAIVHLDSIQSIIGGERQEQEIILEGEPDHYQYQWSPPQGLSCFDCLSPEISPLQETIYQLIVTDSLGCATTFQTKVFVDSPIFVPNAFTPNGDGKNDVLKVFAQNVTIQQFTIFNRWGQAIYRQEGAIPQWTGQTNGQKAPPGTYVYELKGVHNSSGNTFEKAGSLHLIR